VHVKVLRDYGITVGNTTVNSWSRRELHVSQDEVQIKLTLWNEQVLLYKRLFYLNFLLGEKGTNKLDQQTFKIKKC
jgi:hypothetical protein